ncbi:MAG: SGNH/GDSL hydrolase family protein [Pyrinomonadaceae bacterium]
MFVFALTLMIFTNATAQEKVIVAFGDSITAPRKNVVTYSDVIRSEFEKKGLNVKVINSGVGGNTTEHAKKRFEKDVLAHKPDLVILQLGTNDAAIDVWKDPPATESRVAIDVFEKNLRDFIKAIRAQNGKVILVTPPPKRWTEKMKGMYGKPPFDTEDEDGWNLILKRYVTRIKNIAKDEKVILLDLNKAYYKYHKKKGQSMDDLFLDGLHPNSKGQKIEADLLLKLLKKMDFGL